MTADKIETIEDAERAIEMEITQVESKFGTTDKRWNAYIAGLRTALSILIKLEAGLRERIKELENKIDEIDVEEGSSHRKCLNIVRKEELRRILGEKT